MKLNWCGFGIDGIWWCDGYGEGYFYQAHTKFGKTRFVGFNIRLGFLRLRFGKENRKRK